LLLFLLERWTWKITHLCRTIGMSDQRAVGLSGCRTIATLPNPSGFLHFHNEEIKYMSPIIRGSTRRFFKIHYLKGPKFINRMNPIQNYFKCPWQVCFHYLFYFLTSHSNHHNTTIIFIFAIIFQMLCIMFKLQNYKQKHNLYRINSFRVLIASCHMLRVPRNI